jgi:hypothetical protein
VSTGDYSYSQGDPTKPVMNLEGAAKAWNTPTVRMHKGGGGALIRADGRSRLDMLDWQAGQWMTPNVPNGGRTASHAIAKGRTLMRSDGTKVQLGLEHQTQVWSTPKASDGEKGGPNMRGSKGDQPLPSQAAQWPTPMAGASGTDSYNAAGNSDFSRKAMEIADGLRASALTDYSPPDRPTPSGPKSSETRRRLNPLFVEWLMGWPEGLSGFDTAETGLFHWLRLSRGELLRLVSPRRPKDGQGSLFDGPH